MKKLFSTRTSDTAFNVATLLLRLGFGLLMLINHGWPKLTHYAEMQQKFGDPIGLGKPVSLALVVFAEFFCAAFVILGLFTRLACIPLIIAMSVALFSAHQGDFFGKGEMAGVYLIAFLAILVMGPGKASIDRMIYK